MATLPMDEDGSQDPRWDDWQDWDDSNAPSLPLDMDATNSHGFMQGQDDDDDSDDLPPLLPGTDDPHGPLWLCSDCNHPDFRCMHGIWKCAKCGCSRFYDAHGGGDPTSNGSWTYVQSRECNPGDKPGGSHGSDKKKQKPDFPGDRDGEAGEGRNREQAESETMTNDPVIDPDSLRPLSRRQRKAVRNSPQAPQDRAQPRYQAPQGPKVPPPPNVPRPAELPGQAPQWNPQEKSQRRPSDQWRDDMLQNLSKAMTRDKNSDWNNKKGPQPGVKYRGGAPPPPPAWSYSRDDLRAFQKWERKLQVWRVQIASYLPPNEAAMMLYVSLKGEAEEELEYCSLDSINNDKGIDFILESLRKPLMTRSIYLKRRYLHEYENIQRLSNESIKAYCNRYHRTERSLESIGINVGSMYDSEARGSRLLDRMRVSLEQQRLILIGSGQSLHFDEVKEAAQLQFPDHRPTPMVTFMREFDNRGDRQQQAPQQSSPSKGFNFKKGKGKGKDKGKPSQNKTYVTEATAEETVDVLEEEGDGNDIIDNEEQINDEEYVEENQDFDGQAEEEENDDSLDALREAAECLTVTARRLQGLTLGRKFSGQQSIQERKKNTHCAICGERGHWQGDEECQYSNSGGKNQQKGSSAGSSNYKRRPEKLVPKVSPTTTRPKRCSP